MNEAAAYSYPSRADGGNYRNSSLLGGWWYSPLLGWMVVLFPIMGNGSANYEGVPRVIPFLCGRVHQKSISK